MGETKKSAFGTAGLVVGIIGICLSFVPVVNNAAFVLGVLAVVFGIVSLVKKASKGKAIAALILGVLAVAITLAMQASFSKTLDDATNELNQSLGELTGDQTASILEKNLDVTIGTFVVEKGEYIDSYKLPVTLKNKGDERKSFSVEIEAIGADGIRIDTDTVYVDSLGAGQMQTENAFELITSEQAEQMKAATFQIAEVSMY